MSEQTNSTDQEFFSKLSKQYSEVLKLLEEQTVDETEPYRTKYAAQEILKNLLNQLQSTENSNPRITQLLGVVHLSLGITSIETEDLKSGEDHLSNCIRILEDHESEPECVLSSISAFNQLGILWSKRDQPSKSKTFLDSAKQVYQSFKDAKSSDPVGMSALFEVQENPEVDPKEMLEKLHTLTLYYLAQIHGSLENYFESAFYCHETLKRQLEYKDFDMVEWALNAATLSQFFMEKGSFSLARHHLGAASYVLDMRREVLEKNDADGVGSQEAREAEWENYKHRNADVERCWAKYGIELMSTSRERLIKNTENEEKDLTNKVSEISLDSEKDLKFPAIEKEVEKIVSDITDQPLLDFSDARTIFLKTQKSLEVAKKFYTLENHASDYVNVMQDMSQCYKYLAFFEDDEDRRAKMHKRRVDLLENLVKELNPQYYQSACQALWMELGETYAEILDIKMDRLRAMEDRPPPKMLMKINELTTRAIENFRKFIDSVMVEKGEKKGVIPENMVRPVLCAHFYLGRLYNSFITPDKKVQLSNAKNTLEVYTYLVNYCEKDSKAMESMSEELGVCKELVKLLPLKVKKLKAEVENTAVSLS